MGLEFIDPFVDLGDKSVLSGNGRRNGQASDCLDRQIFVLLGFEKMEALGLGCISMIIRNFANSTYGG